MVSSGRCDLRHVTRMYIAIAIGQVALYAVGHIQGITGFNVEFLGNGIWILARLKYVPHVCWNSVWYAIGVLVVSIDFWKCLPALVIKMLHPFSG